jgi:hypothetical protein
VNVRSAKAKGKRLEGWIKDQLLKWFPSLTTDDVRTTVSSETGADIKLSKKAQELVKFKFESKNRETFKTLYSYYEQANKHEGAGSAVVVLKMNRKPALALLDAELFFELIKEK